MRDPVTLRPVCSDDEAFLFNMFRNAHGQTFASLELAEEEKTKLLRLQFEAQQGQYHGQFPDADLDVVLLSGVPIGNMYAMRGPNDYVLIDVSLLPEHRNAGIGAKLVEELVREAKAAKKPLQAHVLKSNPAWHLWRRLGFEVVDDDGVYLRIHVPAC